MSTEDMFWRRANSYQKPYLFLQNSDWDSWTYSMTEQYMNACLLYGLWPGFFSANAADSRYFNTPG